MKNIRVVIGAVFGDEGKGLMTDYYASQFKDKEVLNIRFNGGAQAGHTVVTPDGARHVFSHFGSSSFNAGVVTYLAKPFLVDPIKFNREYDELSNKGIKPKIKIHSACKVVLPWDAITNILIEKARGKNKHGSCGAGIWEAVYRSENKHNYIDAYLSMYDLMCSYGLEKRVMEIRDVYYPKRVEELGLKLEQKDVNLYTSTLLVENYLEEIKIMLSRIEVVDDNVIKLYENIVFEGAQGLLLDWDNVEYSPHITASITGITNVDTILCAVLDENEEIDLEICYVTRSYFTRHGVGKFNTEVENKEVLGKGIYEKTNITNEFQDHFRFGYLDEELLVTTITKDKQKVRGNYARRIALAITHLDQTNNKVLLESGACAISIFDKRIRKQLGLDIVYKTYGESREKVEKGN